LRKKPSPVPSGIKKLALNAPKWLENGLCVVEATSINVGLPQCDAPAPVTPRITKEGNSAEERSKGKEEIS
jgi:hypothetical protein